MRQPIHASKFALGLAAFLAGVCPALAYDVESIGSFHIGGAPVRLEGLAPREIVIGPGTPPMKVDPNGDYHAGQMYVQHVKLKQPAARYPLLMWHTGGITGASWETKPDGRPGWMQFFLRRGHDVYVSDAVERGRATFSRFPEIYRSEPIYRDKKDAWEIFRIGMPGSYSSNPAARKAHDGQLFPLSAFDTLQMQMAPRWATNGDATQAAYNALVQRVCPCVIMAHGQAGHFAFYAALANPDKVKAIVAVEPAFAPKPGHPDLPKLKGTPHLFVWGDYLTTNPNWVEHLAELKPYYEALKAAEVPAEWLDLPEAGIKGNTHMIMMDSNSDQVAARIQAWLAKQKLLKSGKISQDDAAPSTDIAAKSKVKTAARRQGA